MEIQKNGKLTVKDGVAKIEYSAQMDGDQDGRSAGGVKVEAFVDIPELLDESMKDSSTAQLIAKWLDANKVLLPAVEKEI